jgi:ribosome recycling factor
LVTFKKVKAGKASSKHSSKVVEEEPLSQEDPSLILKELEAKYQESLNHFREKVAVTKQGNSNPNLFDDLKVALNHGEVADFLSIAQTSLKGRNLIITVFDPIYAKHVISAILQTNLNLNPEHVPNMPQQLKVSLPPVTRETKLDIVKELKKNFEFFKNSNSFKYSLSSNRADALKELKQFKKNDQTKKTTNDIEKLHKKYTNDLQELFRSAEKQILQ